MNFFRFITHHSQKIALMSLGSGLTLNYWLQPYNEVLTRWSITEFDKTKTQFPSQRIKRLTNEVLSYFKMSDAQKSQFDVFITQMPESIVLGSLSQTYFKLRSQYAFIGLPFFFNFEDASQITLNDFEIFDFLIPGGFYSELGKQCLTSMIVPDSAVKFLLAREIVRLGGQSVDGHGIWLSPRTRSALSTDTSLVIMYANYQFVQYFGHFSSSLIQRRLIALLILYIFTCSLTLFFYYQLLCIWRRNLSLNVDTIVAGMDESFRQGAIDYYQWRLEWNQFWYQRICEFKSEKSTQNKTYNPTGEKRNQIIDTDYYYPADAVYSPFRKSNSTLKNNSSVCIRSLSNGAELWAADGDAIGFGFTSLLLFNIIPSWIATIFGLFSYPATSQLRLNRMKDV